jgi:3-ketosteroid 9alpha-monooxygenase subunit B
MTTPNYFDLDVAEVIRETNDACSFEFEIPEAIQDQFKYRPGQFLTLRIPWQDDFLPRCYSLSSSPFESERLRVTVKRVNDGRGSNWLCDKIKAGDTLQVLKPAGVFVPKSLDRNFLLFAGGSGVTPVLSILRSALTQGEGKIRMLYANRNDTSVIFSNLLNDLASQYPERLQVIHWLDSVQGRPTAPQLARFAEGFADADVFVCGPEPFMQGVEKAMKLAGIDGKSSVHVERFVSLPGESEGHVDSVVAHEGATATKLVVELDGETREIDCKPGEVLLAAMQREGMDPPHSCLVGSCASCMCTLVDGKVDLLANAALDAEELAEGWILACQAIAATDKVRLKFPD